MAQTLEALTRQMGSMESIHSVVHTMKTLSVINAAPYEQAARAIEEYHKTVLEALHAFLSASRSSDFAIDPVGLRVVVVFGSDHGLCGNYNEVTAGHVAEYLSTAHQGETKILCVGAQMADALADRALSPESVFLPPASVDGLGRLANLLTRNLDEARRSAGSGEITVELAYLADVAVGRAPRIIPLLPLDPALVADRQNKPWQSRSLPSFSMPANDLYRALVRAHVFASLVRAAAEAMVSENAARLALMQQAEQSVEDRLDALKSDANALRQSGITTELLDVIIGFEALKGRRHSSRRGVKDAKVRDQTGTEEPNAP